MEVNLTIRDHLSLSIQAFFGQLKKTQGKKTQGQKTQGQKTQEFF